MGHRGVLRVGDIGAVYHAGRECATEPVEELGYLATLSPNVCWLVYFVLLLKKRESECQSLPWVYLASSGDDRPSHRTAADMLAQG